MTWLRGHRRVTEGVLVAVVLWLVLRVAWMSDDGLINVRTALNLAHGNGVGFNAGERVQAFTSPLWFGLEYAVGRPTGEFILTAILLGALCSVAALAVVAHVARTMRQAAFVFLAFAMSCSMIDFSTGGLENGLAMLVMVLVLVAVARPLTSLDDGRRWRWLLAGLAIGGALLVRQDHVLLVGPVGSLVAWRGWRSDRRGLLALVVAAAVPVVVWSAVSWATFGSLVPNTLAAKTNVEISQWKLLGAGLNYLGVSAWSDPVLATAMLLGVGLAVWRGDAVQRAVAAGVVGYVAYLVWIGGDFMAGRFLTTPTVACLWLMATVEVPAVGRFDAGRVAWAAVGLVSVLGAWPMGVERPSSTSDPRWALVNRHGVADEAGVWRAQGWTLSAALGADTPIEFGAHADDYPDMHELQYLEAHWTHVDQPPKGVARPVKVLCGGIGGFGLDGGPGLHIIDTCALVDAFLADLPWHMPPSGYWRIGHWARELPAGYEDAVRFADPAYVQDPVLRARLVELWRRIR